MTYLKVAVKASVPSVLWYDLISFSNLICVLPAFSTHGLYHHGLRPLDCSSVIQLQSNDPQDLLNQAISLHFHISSAQYDIFFLKFLVSILAVSGWLVFKKMSYIYVIDKINANDKIFESTMTPLSPLSSQNSSQAIAPHIDSRSM